MADLELDDKTAGTITALLDKTNGKRKKFKLALADVTRVVADALASPHGLAVRHGGGEFNSKTTLCVGVKVASGVVVGIGQCWGDKPTPGRVWSELGPWMQDFSKNVEKAAKWAAAKKQADRVLVSAKQTATKAKAGAASGDKLLAEVLANPLDDGPRLVYADFLTQQDDPRGELITLQCTIAKTPPRKRRALVAREQALLRKHRRTWQREALQLAEHCEIARGFVYKITTGGTAFANSGGSLLAREPVEHLRVAKPTGPSLAALAGAPHLTRLRRLDFDDPIWLQNAKAVAQLRAFLTSKHVGKVPELAFTIGFSQPYMRAVEPPDVSELFAKLDWPGVTVLEIRTIGAFAEMRPGLATAKLPALKRLVMGLGKKETALRATLKKAFPRATIE